MRILHLGASYPPYRGGMGTVMEQEAVRLALRGHAVSVATLTWAGMRSGMTTEQGVEVHRFRPWIRWTRTGCSLSLVWFVLRGRWDIIHLHLPFFGLQEVFALALWCCWRPKNLVVTYHMDVQGGWFIRAVGWVSRRVFLPTVLAHAKQHLVASAAYAQGSWLADRTYRAAQVVLPFGVDTQRFHADGHVRTETVRFCFLGGLDQNHYFKGLSVLLEALAAVPISTWQLDIGGDGPLRATYEAQARALGLEHRVRFHGRVAEEHLPAFYASADLLLFPSVDRSEAFGMVALEAMASGIGVLASELAGVSDLIVPAVGRLAPPGDVAAWTEMLTWVVSCTPEERTYLGQRARERVEECYTLEQHVAQLEQLYQDVCASSL